MHDFTIFVSSSDNYSDLWDLFFDLFKKNWPDFKGRIVLNTETLSYERNDLDLECTQVGKLGTFGKVFIAGLNTVRSDNVLLIMIDYIFMGEVNSAKILEYFDFFLKKKMDSLCLVYQQYPILQKTEHSEVYKVLPPAPYKMFSFQIAFWKKNTLLEMVLPHEDPWMSEWFGTQRAELMNIGLFCISNEVPRVVPYDLKGCLHQKKWLHNAVRYLESIDYIVDFERRGYYSNDYESLMFRVKLKLKIWTTGLKGSYWDIIKRKLIKDENYFQN